MRSPRITILASLLAVILLAGIAAAATVAQSGPAKFYVEKESYLPNSKVKLYIEFSSPFTGTYTLQIRAPDGKVVDAATRNVVNATKVEYVFQHKDSYGYGTFQAILSFSGYVIQNGQKQNVYSPQPLVVEFTVAPSYSIKGYVVDENGNPVQGACVKVKETGVKTTTNENGEFVLPVPAPGTYTIVSKKTDYMTNSTVVVVKDLGTTELPEPLTLVSQAHMIMVLEANQKAIMSKLDELAKKIDDLASKQDAISNSLNDLAAKVADNSKSISDLKGNLDQLAGQVQALQQEVSNLKAGLDQVKASLQNLASKEYVDQKIAGLEDRLGQLEDSIAALQNALNQLRGELANYATKDDLNAAVSQAKSAAVDEAKKYADQKYSELDAKIGDLQQALQNLDGKLKQLDSTVNSLKGDVDNLKNSVIQQLTQNLQKATDSANRASTMAMAAVALAIIGIIITVVVMIKLSRMTVS